MSVVVFERSGHSSAPSRLPEEPHRSVLRVPKPENLRQHRPRLQSAPEATVRPLGSGSEAEIAASAANKEEGAGGKSGAGARYGPRSSPLFYTALQRMPARLVLPDLPEENCYRLTFGHPGSEGRIEPLLTTTTLPGRTSSWSLADLPLEENTLYAWRVEPLLRPVPYGGASNRSGGEAFPQEGRFWRLDDESVARLERGKGILAQVTEADFAAIALALLMAEIGLYHDALRLIRNGPARSSRSARVLLAHIVQALVYKQMGRRMEQEKTGAKIEIAPACFLEWARNREQYYREQASARLGSEQTRAERAQVAAAAEALGALPVATKTRRAA